MDTRILAHTVDRMGKRLLGQSYHGRKPNSDYRMGSHRRRHVALLRQQRKHVLDRCSERTNERRNLWTISRNPVGTNKNHRPHCHNRHHTVLHSATLSACTQSLTSQKQRESDCSDSANNLIFSLPYYRISIPAHPTFTLSFFPSATYQHYCAQKNKDQAQGKPKALTHDGNVERRNSSKNHESAYQKNCPKACCRSHSTMMVLWKFVFFTEPFCAIITSKKKCIFSTADGALRSTRTIFTLKALRFLPQTKLPRRLVSSILLF